MKSARRETGVFAGNENSVGSYSVLAKEHENTPENATEDVHRGGLVSAQFGVVNMYMTENMDDAMAVGLIVDEQGSTPNARQVYRIHSVMLHRRGSSANVSGRTVSENLHNNYCYSGHHHDLHCYSLGAIEGKSASGDCFRMDNHLRRKRMVRPCMVVPLHSTGQGFENTGNTFGQS